MKFKFIKEKGFSIVEIMVVVFIVAMGLLGVSSLVMQSIKAQNIDKNTLIASQLAQEGIELVRNKRDSNWKIGDNWDSGLSAGNYIIDYTGNISLFSGNKKLFINSDGYYAHEGAIPTSFTRLISITNNSSISITVICTVEWTTGTQTNSYVAETVLYNWK
ncbi:MAG: prepilin-type N-terminal cleavage/methylation domain-containing protein [Patescibacteria group bacterium]|nr:prepilin-type N-terminal cleavage/methylation domain-containing protein [Patescibacteria group bacterium]MDD4611270.1 prepilin-type N-terminal cleavage/methylation domain-containing protein [Patescibacteria group bacterium]